jgi:hypothetical protein
MSNPGL